ncbi:hypothetical protein ONZ45_g8592 [Pleurotus djamor]|nr:hypothetical protein ONZ45_g16136 [Pleurotus djamor]KAJ8509207.1 hypothetical protein ONZ45_g8592 [Pleurotus djamor]
MANVDPLSEVIASLTSVQLIPDVVPTPTYFTPTTLFSVIFPTGKEVLLGNELTKEDAADEPEVVITPMGPTPDARLVSHGEGETTYTLVMCDPDAPSRKEPKYKEFRHWVITGLKAPAGTAVETNNLTALKTKPSTTPYRPPGPPPGSGLHRYIFLLYEEPAGQPLTIPQGAPEYGALLEERRSWTAVKFGETYGLKLVGANYFVVRSVE